MVRTMERRFLILVIGILLWIAATPVFPQELPSLPSLMDSDSTDSLMNLLKNDLMKRYQNLEAKQNNEKNRPERPRPELGKSHGGNEPVDISQYLGPDASPEKTLEKLQELGRIPSSRDIPSPPSATDSRQGLWSNVPPEKRFEYAQDLFKRRKYDETQKELEILLNDSLKDNERFDALAMREKCLFHRRFYDTVQDDYYRLYNFYPKKKKEALALKQYLAETSGLASLQKAVMEDPNDPGRQRQLLDLYEKMGWLDFAEEFFLTTINNTSAPTVKSLSEVYYKKKDYDMLVHLSQAGQKLHPDEAEFLYNEGVGLYALGDPASRQKAKDAFQNAYTQALSPRLRQNAQWYLDRLSPAKP